jgi:hypothetical protein
VLESNETLNRSRRKKVPCIPETQAPTHAAVPNMRSAQCPNLLPTRLFFLRFFRFLAFHFHEFCFFVYWLDLPGKNNTRFGREI